MKKQILKLGLAALALAFTYEVAQAQLVTNDFSGTFTWGSGGNVAEFPYNGDAIDDVTVGDATKVGITTSSSASNFRGSQWPQASSIDLDYYIEFTLTTDAGTTINMSSITFGLGRSATGPVNWEWRSSVDNYAAALTDYSALNAALSLDSGVITNPDSNSNWAGNTLDLSDASFQGLTDVTFRFYGYASEAGTGTGGLAGPLTFEGASVVPEPSTYALLVMAGMGLAGFVVRGRRS